MLEPAVLLGPESQARLKRGVDTLANLLALTLGPVQGGIISARELGQPLEFLTDAATIARRFLALPDRAENAGAMLLRNLVWRLHQTSGDGCATGAVLTRALIAESQRYLVAGANPALLRQGIEQRIRLQGDIPSPVDPPEACRFAGRCFRTIDVCRQQVPPLEGTKEHLVACFNPAPPNGRATG
jgi:oligopeptide/dipeptide ABC transporter ATP-binding protein